MGAIWRERNSRIFKGKSSHESRVLRNVKDDIKLRFQTVQLKSNITLDMQQVADAFRGLERLVEWRITHIFREGNNSTDLLAARRQTRGEHNILPHQTWLELNEALAANKARTCFTQNK
ncbi:hypothetical protein QJS10_CPB12g00943 [Acorus calamus]|uniref:RNase H type-1 domain-containing protein n=1 Tax=Acorus calamus TaxID=4465 RepID=A0AAV9DKX4_ACOCL|nr:hypothetical protein QJS10_CPB12g00943 [Acorus calamus]